VIEDIKLLSRTFVSCDFRHVFRVLNNAAHVLARKCENLASSVWRDVAPDFGDSAFHNMLIIVLNLIRSR
jgi:hypothetical protein